MYKKQHFVISSRASVGTFSGKEEVGRLPPSVLVLAMSSIWPWQRFL
jgi:hypothetical protein